MIARASIALCAALVLTSLGCGGGSNRNPVQGEVTYKGQPVPWGTILFRPDRSRGGSGPTGFANIVDGQFNTQETGKGAVSGPVKIVIQGYEGPEPTASSLFPAYQMTTDITGGSDPMKIEVSENG